MGTEGNASAGFALRWDGSRWTRLPPAGGAVGRARDGAARRVVRREARVRRGRGRLLPARRYEAPRPLVERWTGPRGGSSPPHRRLLALRRRRLLLERRCVHHRRLRRAADRRRGAARRALGLPRLDAPGRARGPGSARPPTQRGPRPRRRFCEAVGFATTTRTTQGTAERWDGGGWHLEPVPGPLPGPSQLLGVTCAPRGRCSAVGEALTSPTGNELPLFERRTAAGWRVEPGRLPAGGVFGRLWGRSLRRRPLHVRRVVGHREPRAAPAGRTTRRIASGPDPAAPG